MAKIPKISGNVMIKYLIKKEFSVTGRTGSHTKLRHNNLVAIVPAGNKIIKPGLLLGILADINMTREEFMSDYNKIM